MSKNKGKPAGKETQGKTALHRRGNYKRALWPEDAMTQHVENATARQPGNPRGPEEFLPGEGNGRNRRAGSPV